MSACVYASQEELWEDLLYFALSQAQRERLRLERAQEPLRLSRKYEQACTRARLHLYNLHAREYLVSPVLVDMARCEGIL
jgi:hypothetical protein